MKLYKDLALLGCFSRSDIVKLTGSEAAANWYIKSYLEKGYIERVHRDLYAAISFESTQPIPNRFQIASKTAEDACVSLHSAFEYYGLANQVYYDVYFASAKRSASFFYDGLNYRFVSLTGAIGINENQDGVRVTSIERTIVDSIKNCEKYIGLEEVLRCISLVPAVKEDDILKVLAMYNQTQLYQKVGYILETFSEVLYLSQDFFKECRKHISNSKSYLIKGQKGKYCKCWKLISPDLKKMINKGVNQDAL